MRHVWFFLSLIVSLTAPKGQARVFTHSLYERFYADGSTFDHRVVIDLTGEWKSDVGRSFRVPFSSDVHERLELSREFFLPQAPTDSLVLYFEGLAQRSAVYLNNRLLVVVAEPFEPLILRLAPDLFQAQWNLLRVVLSDEKPYSRPFDPPMFIGIHRPVYILERAYEVQQLVRFPRITQADSTLVWAPYGRRGYQVDERQFKTALKLVAESGVRALYIPYRLSNREYAWIAEAGLSLSLELGRWVALFEEPDPRPLVAWGWPVWKKDDGSGHWGLYADRYQLRRPMVPVADQAWLAGLSLLLLGLLAYWKAAVPVVFDLLLGRRKRRGGQARALNERPPSGVVVQVVAVRLLLLSFGGWALSLLLVQAGRLDWFDVVNRPSLMRQLIEYTSEQPAVLGLGWLAWLGLLLALRQLVLWGASLVYGQRELGWQVLQIENLSAFPVLWLVVGVGVIGLIQSQAAAAEWGMALGILLLAFYVFSLLYLYNQLSNRIGLRSYLVLLYICAVEVAPWVVVL